MRLKLIAALLLPLGLGMAQCASGYKYIVNCQTAARYCAPVYDSTPVCQTPIVVTSLPTTCVIGDVVSVTTNSNGLTVGLYMCSSTNTWTSVNPINNLTLSSCNGTLAWFGGTAACLNKTSLSPLVKSSLWPACNLVINTYCN